jgi:murein DD-endopeptidase MepM/ murein hydrolase activator NlpD
MRNLKFFVFSPKTLLLKEIHLFKTKVLGSAVGAGVVVLVLLLALNHLSNDVLGIGYDRMAILTTENRILKDQLRELSRKAELIQRSLEALSERGNDLRLLVDLPKIDEDTRYAAIGGSVSQPEFPFLKGEAADILAKSKKLVDQLERETKLQQTSYEEVYKRYEYNQKFFAHLPAIKPMDGHYTINGFGMRIHPVLGVYRMHEGIDIISDVGTNVYATGDGVVTYAGRTQGGYGAVIEISHGYRYSSLYAHLSKILVRSGQQVKRGELIAKSGRSGLVSGPHLHYEIRFSGRKQNPVDFFFDDIDASKYRTQLAAAR